MTPITFGDGEAYVIYKPVMAWPSEELSLCVWARFTPLAGDKLEEGKNGTVVSYASRKKDDELALARSPEGMLRVVIKGEAVETQTRIDDGQWHHMCVTWSSITGDAKVYIDGLEAASKSKHRVGAKVEPSGSFVLGEAQQGGPGKIQSTAGTSFRGDAAELSVWKRVLDRKEVLSMSKSSAGKGKQKGCVLLWSFVGSSEEEGVQDMSDNDAEVSKSRAPRRTTFILGPSSRIISFKP